MLVHTIRRDNMSPTKASIRQTRYDSTHCRTYGLKLNKALDADIIEKLSSVPSMQGYIKQLIRRDISGSVPVSMCDEAKEMLQEEADKRGMDVCKLAKLIISEWIVNNSLK